MSFPLPRFTVANGLSVQALQLADWKSVLTPEAYEALADFAENENTKLDPERSTGYDVARGDTLNSFVHNLAIRWGSRTTPR